ncbi:hypothetical protein ACWEUT_42740, partial [Actinomadura geliboluensis]
PPALGQLAVLRRRLGGRGRQTHLAPQLKQRVDAHLAAQGQAPPPGPAGPAEPPPGPESAGMPLAAPVPVDEPPPPRGGTVPQDDDAARSPEAMRSMMSAMQAGWRRGRQDAADAEAAQAEPNPGEQEDDTP